MPPLRCWWRQVMEYCMGGSLCDLMAITDRVLSEEQIASVLKMSLQGLAYFHSLNHLHRDIKSVGKATSKKNKTKKNKTKKRRG